jgi:hypothetical protein
MKTVVIIVLGIWVLGLLITVGLLFKEYLKPVAVPTPPLPTLPPTPTPFPTPTIASTNTPIPTPTPIQVTICPQTACPPVGPPQSGRVPEITNLPTRQADPLCNKHGQEVWAIKEEGVGQKITFGDLTECCWMAGWVKVSFPKPKIWLFAVPPKTHLTFQGFLAGQVWFIGGNRKTVEDFLDHRAKNFEKDCAQEGLEIQTVYLPDNSNSFPLLVYYQSRWTVDP